MDPITLAALTAVVPSAGNLASTLLTNRANRRLAEHQSEVNYSQALDMWNRTNAYNSPAAQMQRYTDAGLNPMLIYGQQNTASMADVSTYQRPQMESPRFDSILKLEQIKGVALDNKLKNASFQAQVLKNLVSARLASEMLRHTRIVNPYVEGLKKMEYDLRSKSKTNLEKKYEFENYFYDLKLNPYNSSTIGSPLNIGISLGKQLADILGW